MAKKKVLKPDEQQPVFQLGDTISIKTLNRQREDIGKWRTALQSAESKTSPKRVPLYTLYNDILLDAHLKSVWEKRKLAILNRKLVFKKDGTEVEEANLVLQRTWMYETLGHIMDSKLWGHSLLEFGLSGGVINGVELIERRNVSPELGLVLKQETDTIGIDFRNPPISNYVLEVGGKYNLGLLLEAAPYVVYKRGTFGDWAQFNEIFGMPFRKYTYDGHDEKTRILLEEAAAKSGSAGYAVLPKDSNIEWLTNTSNSGSKDTYQAMIDICNKEISKLILGNTMTTEDGASRSQAEVHAESEDSIKEADKLWVQSILNDSFRYRLVTLGYPFFADGEFEFDDPMDIDKELKRDKQLFEMFDLDVDYYRAKYGDHIKGVKSGGFGAALPGK
ncbi:MAG: DUF935 domain-containing protein [Flavobacteriales bacterium]|nr:DUF935 domain-containing protein [Flavobacteriales bacterium]